MNKWERIALDATMSLLGLLLVALTVFSVTVLLIVLVTADAIVWPIIVGGLAAWYVAYRLTKSYWDKRYGKGIR